MVQVVTNMEVVVTPTVSEVIRMGRERTHITRILTEITPMVLTHIVHTPTELTLTPLTDIVTLLLQVILTTTRKPKLLQLV